MTHRTTVEWMGLPVETLAGVWPQEPRAVVVGLHPTPTSLAAGHHHQGSLARRQLLRLADAGLFARPRPGRTSFEEVALGSRVGLADVVRRPVCSERHLRPEELERGRRDLLAELEARRVPLVICLLARPAQVLLGGAAAPGLQRGSLAGGARVFRMPGPFAPAGEVRDVMAELARGLAPAG